jgi:monoamine oxidase
VCVCVVQIRTSCPVTRIDYNGSGDSRVTLTCQNGRRVRCKAVIVTVPIRILQDGVIAFTPPLPAPKQGALQRIKMGNVIKVGEREP